MKSDLRPIGTEFFIDYLAEVGSTDLRITRIKYRVKSHCRSARFLGDREGIDAEEWEPIKIEKGGKWRCSV